MKKFAKKCISIVLLVCLLTSLLSGLTTVRAYAETTSDVSAEESAEASTEASVTWEDVLAGMATPYDFYGELDPENVPEAIGYKNATQRVHIERMYEEEGDSLYNVIFKNADGTRTVYLFDYPVKYVSDTGEIKDITLDIASDTAQAGSFVSAENSVQTSLSRELSDGITLEDSDVVVTLVPIAPQSSASTMTSTPTTTMSTATEAIALSATRMDDKTISYYYDNKTTIEYSLTYTGFKEDIVVSEYTGQTEYDFTLLTNGLSLVEIDGSYYLTDEEGNVKATLGDIIIFTADEKHNTFGSMTYETIRANQEYRLTIHVDADFLQDEATAYPIRIDPTIEIYYTKDGAGAIEDVTVYSYSSADGTATSLHIGKHDTYGSARVLMRFPNLNLSGITSAACITSASVEIRDLMCESVPLDVYCYVYNGGDWSEEYASWSAAQMCDFSTLLSSQAIAYPYGIRQAVEHRYSFDITEAVKGWMNGDYSQGKGIIFKADISVENRSTALYKTFASYNGTSYKPTLRITYDNTKAETQVVSDGTYYLNNMYTGEYLMYFDDTEVRAWSGLLDNIGRYVRWEIRNVDGGHAIRYAEEPTKYLAVPTDKTSSDVELVEITDAEVPARCIWNISLSELSGCLIKNTYNSKYLYTSGDYVYTSTTLGASGGVTYQERVWRIAREAYVEDRELAADASINTLVLSVGATGTPNVVKSPYNAIWASASDFNYSPITSDYVTVSKGVFRANKTGVTTVIATHKVTNCQYIFAVVVGNAPGLTVLHYVDQGYRLKFGGEEDISAYTKVVADKFESIFGLELSFSIYDYTSVADTCKMSTYGSVTLSNLTASCSHSRIQNHLTVTALRDDLDNGTNVITRVLWTGHTMPGNPRARSYGDTKSVIMTPYHITDAGNGYANYDDATVRENNIYTLMHELSHQLSVPDHYCYKDFDEENKCSNSMCDVCVYRQSERACIMTRYYSIVEHDETKLYCDSCLEIINSHLANHHQ